MTATQLLYTAAGYEIIGSAEHCWLCGGEAFDVIPLRQFIRPTFMDLDKAAAPDSESVCGACAWCHVDRSAELAGRVGKSKLQRMRNYSHFITSEDGQLTWHPLSKADKRLMAKLLLSKPFPRLAVVAESGQKHIIFRACINPAGAGSGWVQFEERTMWSEPDRMRPLLGIMGRLLAGKFSKREIASGHYSQHRITKFGMKEFFTLEASLRQERGGETFALCLFLAQKEEG